MPITVTDADYDSSLNLTVPSKEITSGFGGSETLTLSDELSTFRILKALLSETLTLSDEVAAGPSLSETLTLTDEVEIKSTIAVKDADYDSGLLTQEPPAGWVLVNASQTVKAISLDIPFGYAENSRAVKAHVQQYGANTKSIISDIVYYSWRTKPVQANIETHGYTHRTIRTKVELKGESTKTVRANVIRKGKTLKEVQAKIWYDSSKTLRSVRAKIGEPANTKPITLKVGFPKTTRPVGLKTPTGYKEIWKPVNLKVEKYSKLVTRIIVADTRQTTRGVYTKLVSLNVAKFPYNTRSVMANVILQGESIKIVKCNVLQTTGTETRTIGCDVNKSRQIMAIGCNVLIPYGESVKAVSLNIWSDAGESTKSVGLSASKVSESVKAVSLNIWSDSGESIKSVGLSSAKHQKTYRNVEADVSPTHRWTPVSCDIVNSSKTHRWITVDVINEAWSYIWKRINTKIEKYAQHTKNIRARRKVQVNVWHVDTSNIRRVSVNVSAPAVNTRPVKLKIHLYKVYGTITDENDDPVKDATVFLYKPAGSGEFFTAKTATTSSAGYYEIPEIPYGDYQVIVIKQAHDLYFSSFTIDGDHVDVQKDMPSYTVGKDTCIEEIMNPKGDLFRFQVLYDEVFADGTRIIDMLILWGDLYGTLPTWYRETDGIFMVESPTSARLTVLQDFFETGGSREEGKDDHFVNETENVSWFLWKSTLYHSNFIGFVVRCHTRGEPFTVLSTNIGGQYQIPDTPQDEDVPPDDRLPPGGGGGGGASADSVPHPGSETSSPGNKHVIVPSHPTPGIVTPAEPHEPYTPPSPPSPPPPPPPPLPYTARSVRCSVRYYVRCVPTEHLALGYGPGYTTFPTISGFILTYPILTATSRSVRCNVIPSSLESSVKHIRCMVNDHVVANVKPVRCVVNQYVYTSSEVTRPISCTVTLPANTKSVVCKVDLGLLLAPELIPVSGEVEVIDQETGLMLYICHVADDGWYTFSVPSDHCYIIILSRFGYRSHMQIICIGTTPLVDRNTSYYGGPPFECTINCYYYTRAFEFPGLYAIRGGTIYGHVYNSRTLKPICNALITVDDFGGYVAVSDENGYYKVFTTPGIHDMVCSRGREYKRAEASVEITSDVEQDFYLDPVVRVGITFTGGLTHKPIYI